MLYIISIQVKKKATFTISLRTNITPVNVFAITQMVLIFPNIKVDC